MLPFKIRNIDHLVLRVKQVEALLDFYQQVLGCSLERSQPEIGLYQLRAGANLIDLQHITESEAEEKGHNLDHFCLRIDPFDGPRILEHLASHGLGAGKVESRYGAEGQGPSIYLNDPAGNTVELKGPAFLPVIE